MLDAAARGGVGKTSCDCSSGWKGPAVSPFSWDPGERVYIFTDVNMAGALGLGDPGGWFPFDDLGCSSPSSSIKTQQ